MISRPRVIQPRAWLLGTVVSLGTVVLAGVAWPAAARAQDYSGVCPVLGRTQPPYPAPALASEPAGSAAQASAIPQEPVYVTVRGQVYPICAVYMSIQDSGQPLPEDGAMADGARSEVFPDLKKQPWIRSQAPADGSRLAREFTDALIATASWQKHGQRLQVNRNDLSNQSDDESTYFLWAIGAKDGFSASTFYRSGRGASGWTVNQSSRVALDERAWFWVLDAPGQESVPGPLPLLGAGAAFAWTRRLRRRIRQRA